MELIPLLQQCDIEKLGVVHVGERVMLVSLAKALESKLDKRTKITNTSMHNEQIHATLCCVVRKYSGLSINGHSQ